MATSSSKQQTTIYPDFEAATERARESNERLFEAGRKVTLAYLDGVERYVHGLAQFERKLGEQSRLEPFNGVLGAHAKMTEDLTTATVSATRELIAA
ncbi:MAG: hypothetical protein WAL63_21785 [Solirubrobacteraceae bacterium]